MLHAPFSVGKGKLRQIHLDPQLNLLTFSPQGNRANLLLFGGAEIDRQHGIQNSLYRLMVIFSTIGYRKGGHVVLESQICFNYARMCSAYSGIFCVSILTEHVLTFPRLIFSGCIS